MVNSMNSEDHSKVFDYIWIVRCSGTNINYNVEYRLAPEAPRNGIRPLIEVINSNIFNSFTRLFRKKYGEVLVDFPLYLLEASNKFFDSVQSLYDQYQDQISFFQAFRGLIDIPVVSANHEGILDYGIEEKILQEVKQDFDKIAVRVRVPTFELRNAPTVLGSYQSLLSNMEENDILLLDVFNVTGVENQIQMNLKQMSGLVKDQDLEVFVLNAFEPFDLRHNFGPLFSRAFSFDGFGDFATEKRFPPAGGRAQRRIVRYYYWDRYLLREIARTSYELAVGQLQRSNYWANHASHVSSCNVCSEVQNNHYNEGHIFWKRFRILHYLNSIINETKQQFSAAVSDEDLDPDGYDLIYNVSES